MSLVETAKAIATEAHAGQKRKYTGDDYITHPQAVVRILKTIPFPNINYLGHTRDEMLAAAWLHDVVEDTDTTLQQIRKATNKTVASLVKRLTDISKPSHGNRMVRKSIDRWHTARGDFTSKTIKLADLIDNSDSIIKYDVGFRKVYMQEMALLLAVLKGGHPTLQKTADDIVSNYYNTFFKRRIL